MQTKEEASINKSISNVDGNLYYTEDIDLGHNKNTYREIPENEIPEFKENNEINAPTIEKTDERIENKNNPIDLQNPNNSKNSKDDRNEENSNSNNKLNKSTTSLEIEVNGKLKKSMISQNPYLQTIIDSTKKNLYLLACSLLTLFGGFTFAYGLIKEQTETIFGLGPSLTNNIFIVGVAAAALVGIGLDMALTFVDLKTFVLLGNSANSLFVFLIALLVRSNKETDFGKGVEKSSVKKGIYVLLYFLANFAFGANFFLAIKAIRTHAPEAKRSSFIGVASCFFGLSVLFYSQVKRLLGNDLLKYFYTVSLLLLCEGFACFLLFSISFSKSSSSLPYSKEFNLNGKLDEKEKETETGKDHKERKSVVSRIRESSVFYASSHFAESVLLSQLSSLSRTDFSRSGNRSIKGTQQIHLLQERRRSKLTEAVSKSSRWASLEDRSRTTRPEFSITRTKIFLSKRKSTKEMSALSQQESNFLPQTDFAEDMHFEIAKEQNKGLWGELNSFLGITALLTVFFLIGVQKNIYNLLPDLQLLFGSSSSSSPVAESKRETELETWLNVVALGSAFGRLVSGFVLDFLLYRKFVYSPYALLMFGTGLIAASCLFATVNISGSVRYFVVQTLFGISGGVYALIPVQFALLFSLERFTTIFGISELMSVLGSLFFTNLPEICKRFVGSNGAKEAFRLYFGLCFFVLTCVVVLNEFARRKFNSNFIEE